ncbi:DUF2752 domain-containing protein [bacterium]|nr:DUF2752 domain-containing protein [bacterium]
MSFRFHRSHVEAFIWVLALFLLAINNPDQKQHFTLCLYNNIGLPFCPGCGLGRSISWLFRGEIVTSFYTHPLGIMAVIVIARRVFTIFKKNKPILTRNKDHE